MYDVILFGGTTEGRLLAEFLSEAEIPSLVCVATSYGSGLLTCTPPATVHTGRIDEAGMTALIAGEKPKMVLDATHPYAQEASGNICSACSAAGARYVRIRRESAEAEACIRFDGMPALVEWLNGTQGVIFSSLGAKEAGELTAVKNYRERVILRMLPSAEGIAACIELGYPMKNLCCMQGPFSEQFNRAQFIETGAKILLTKESGTSGGFLQKLEAAKKCGMTTAVLTRPEDPRGVSLADAKDLIREVFT